MYWRTIPTFLALILLGAHFLRAGSILLAAACVLLPLLLLIRRRVALRIVQCALAAGVVVWIHTALVLTQMRMQLGVPWLRMLLILSAVCLFTAGCVWLLQTKAVKQHFPLQERIKPTDAV